MKNLIYIFLLLIPFGSVAQNYADKSFYLVDSLDLEVLSPEDKKLVEASLKKYHNSKNDTDKVNALNSLCENMMHDDWSKYQFFQNQLIETQLSANPPPKIKSFLLASLASSTNNIGTIYSDRFELLKALSFYQKSLKILEEIGDKKEFVNPLSSLGLTYYRLERYPEALDCYNKLLKLQEENGDKESLALSLSIMGSIYDVQGDNTMALEYQLKSLKKSKEIGDQVSVAQSLNDIGLLFVKKGDIPQALKYHYKSIKIHEKLDNQQGIATSTNNIGSIHYGQKDFDKALNSFRKSYKIFKKIGNKDSAAKALNNIAFIYQKQRDFDKALNYYKKCYKALEETGSKEHLAAILNNIADIYKEQEDVPKALIYYQQSLTLKKEIGHKEGVLKSLNGIGVCFLTQRNTSKAKEYFERSLNIAQELGFPNLIGGVAKNLSDIYETQGKGLLALKMYKLHITMRDSMNNEVTQKATAQQQAKYEYEKQKVLDDAEHDKILAIEQEEKEKQQILTGATTGGLGLVIIFLIFVFNRLRVTKKQKLVIEKQKEEVELAHSQLEEKNKEITDSITYAKRIQSAILPPAKVVKEYLQESFILYKPKDIVAGDFYWLESIGNRVLFAAADCTGHGVPGAMVSVVCNNGLNRSVREHGLSDPGEILTKTREIVVAEFEKSEEEVKDGMDIAICSLEGNTLKYAGAHNPLWVIRNGELLETKANKQPIGQFENPEPYTTHTIDLQKGDSIYIFSDGYADQFGGEKGKKLKTSNFKKLLLSIQNENMQTQKQLIDDAFEKWRGNLEQLDDVCVIGIKIN